MKQTDILVSGASGQSGSLIVQAIAAQQRSVRALVRDPGRAKHLSSQPGVEIRVGDMLRRDTLGAALDGVRRAILISSANDCMVDTQCHFIDACKAAGVEHVIKFSGEESQQGYDPQRFRFTREHEQIEDYLEQSGMLWTHLRPSQFMQVYLREATVARTTGELRLPLQQIQMSPVDLRDVANMAAALLVNGGHTGEALRITGPEALSMADIASVLGRVTGRTIRYIPIDWTERAASLAAAGLPAYFIDALKDQAAERTRNPRPIIDTGTHALFGLTPTSFNLFADQHAPALNGHA